MIKQYSMHEHTDDYDENLLAHQYKDSNTAIVCVFKLHLDFLG
jgi:hypothetical protein